MFLEVWYCPCLNRFFYEINYHVNDNRMSLHYICHHKLKPCFQKEFWLVFFTYLVKKLLYLYFKRIWSIIKSFFMFLYGRLSMLSRIFELQSKQYLSENRSFYYHGSSSFQIPIIIKSWFKYGLYNLWNSSFKGLTK